MSITDESNPSYSMPNALIKATYNDHFSISLFTDSLSSLSKKIQYRATCSPFYPLLLCYHTQQKPYKNVPAGASCIPLNAAIFIEKTPLVLHYNDIIRTNTLFLIKQDSSIEYFSKECERNLFLFSIKDP